MTPVTELRAPARAAIFVAGLAVVLVAALGVGRLVGPVDVQASPAHTDEGGHEDEHADEQADGHGEPAGHEDSAYRLELPEVRYAAGEQPLTFTVVGPDGPVTSYDERHERDLHLIVVRRDLTGFQHVHPALDTASGKWTVDVALTPGSWRVLADFVPAGGEQMVLGADVLVEGSGEVLPLGEDVLGTSVDGYDVTLGVATQAGVESRAVVTVMRDGEPVTDLGEYLGELGHLVVLRDGDLTYVHGHPVASTSTGPTIPFDITFPSGGRYRLFLEFSHGGAVHTAEFTLSAEAGDGHDHDHGDETGDSGEEGEHGH